MTEAQEGVVSARKAYRAAYAAHQSAGVTEFKATLEALRLASRALDQAEVFGSRATGAQCSEQENACEQDEGA